MEGKGCCVAGKEGKVRRSQLALGVLLVTMATGMAAEDIAIAGDVKWRGGGQKIEECLHLFLSISRWRALMYTR